MTKFQASNKFPCLPAGRNDPIIKQYRGIWNLNIGYYWVIGAYSFLHMKTEVDDITVSDEIFLPFRTEESFLFCQMFGATGDEIIE